MATDTTQRESARRPNGTNSLRAARLVAGVVFVIFGLGKFVNHAAELSSFKTYGIPAPDVMVYAIGALEAAGGAALLAGVALAPVALLLAGNMAVAIVVSGIGEGEVVPSLTLAPALLIVMVWLLWARRDSARSRAG